MTPLYAAFVIGIPLLLLLVRRIASPPARQALYLTASYAFYLTFGWRFFAILLASSLFNYYWGAVVRGRPTSGVLWVGILANVALLSTFKYLPSLAALFAGSSDFGGRVAHLALPVGISFWTFQGLSYLIDQYREERLDPTLLEFLLYMGFAPTVLSGPICRLPELLPQLRHTTNATWDDVCVGARSVWVGMLMITLGRILGSGVSGRGVNWGFDHVGAQLSGADVWLLLVGYGFQLFFDFAGYSRVVIGAAQMFGIGLPENFRRPYLSPTPTAFWQRWHMSLSFWIRDYLFMPLATMRREVWWRNLALVVSMVVFGLWHKASLLFLVWGMYQGLLLLGHRLLQQWQRKRGQAAGGAWGSVFSWLITFAAINFAWIAFRAPDWQQASKLAGLALAPFSAQPSALSASFYLLVLGIVGTYFALEGLVTKLEPTRSLLTVLPVELRYVLYAGIFYFTVFHSAEPQTFIYLQF
ncbi:MAG: MBOAT family O-acyltransferase [Gemmatimonadaceae bacterium]